MTQENHYNNTAGDHDTPYVLLMESVVRHRRMIQSYAYSIVRDFHLAEDIFQEVAVVVARQQGTLPPIEELTPWLKEVTRRKSLELLRRHKRMPTLLSEETLERAANELEKVEAERDDDFRAWRLKATAACVAKLKGMARRVVELRYGEDRNASCGDIARVVGRSVKTVYNVLGKAREALLACIEREQSKYLAGLKS